MAAKTQKAHVVVVPYPSQGHINPLLQFAKLLASKGVKATIATTHYTVSSISAPTVGVEPISDGFETGFAQAKDEQAFLDSFRSNGSTTLSDLVRKYEKSDCPISCVVYDSFLPWALHVAKRHGVYAAAFFTNSAAVCSIFCLVSSGNFQLEEGVVAIPGLPPLALSDLPGFIRFPDSYPAYLGMVLCQYDHLDKVDWIFSNSFHHLESKEAASVKQHWPAKLIGPMIPSSYLGGRIKGDKGYGASLWKPLDDECSKWLETKPPGSVAYISFGSMVSLTDEQMAEISTGLVESGLDFLWVVRDSELSKLPKQFRESNPSKGLIVPWCNQLELLAHRATACFLTHCGWNSTLEGLSLGMPMVAMPQWSDQVTNAKYVQDVWRTGVRVKEDASGVARRREIVKCLKEVMNSKEIKEAARKWREMAVEAASEGGGSDIEIDDFVKSLMKAVPMSQKYA